MWPHLVKIVSLVLSTEPWFSPKSPLHMLPPTQSDKPGIAPFYFVLGNIVSVTLCAPALVWTFSSVNCTRSPLCPDPGSSLHCSPAWGSPSFACWVSLMRGFISLVLGSALSLVIPRKRAQGTFLKMFSSNLATRLVVWPPGMEF